MDSHLIKNNTKSKIFSTLILFTKDKTIYTVTVAELTRKIGINRSTFYLYFTDISDAISQMEKLLIENIINVLKRTRTLHSDDAIELDMYKAITYSIDNNSDAFIALLGTNGDQQFANRLKQSIAPFIGPNGITKTTKNSDIPEDFAEDFIINSIFSIVLFWINHNAEMPYEKVAKIIYKTRRLSPLEIAGVN
ncbi:TetR-like C-terminal domain-containing protein [Fructobacillus durionis]|uniref:Transcriptional regulator, TetR family n=1 Tax=Fructobacillus durionis TaxID=283737 RepID=A0A1I1EHJ2_9LACO|nr:TetR-like C-terminal domain-containing protein [Fructobacillus durionis]SFB86615.1 transcriptional regulator, TetR family [Fructobacillus durionis]